MFLVIGEKPSVSQVLAKVLKAEKREEGYLAGEGCLVSWCFGHLAEYASPEIYDERYAKWDFSDLPIIPEKWKLTVAKDKKGQQSGLNGNVKASAFRRWPVTAPYRGEQTTRLTGGHDFMVVSEG